MSVCVIGAPASIWESSKINKKVDAEVEKRSEELRQDGVPPDTVEQELARFRVDLVKAAKMAKAASNGTKGQHAAGSAAAEEAAKDQSAAGHAPAGEAAQAPVAASPAFAGEAAQGVPDDAAGLAPAGEAAHQVPVVAAGLGLAGEAAQAGPEELPVPQGPPVQRGPPVPKSPRVPEAGAAAAHPAKKFRKVTVEGPNRDYLSEVQDDINTILNCRAFKDIAQAEPMPIREDAECGIQEPFHPGQCATALRSRGTYISGFNFFWLDLVRSVTPGIPLSRERVRELAAWMFREGPVPIKKALGVVVSNADFPVLAHKGSLLMITPEERAHAILMKVASDIRDNGAKLSQEWKKVLLSVPVYIDVIPKEEKVQWEAFNARQAILQEHWTMARTAQQQCYEVVSVKNSLQKDLGRQPSKKEISDKFRQNAKMAAGNKDDFSENFVKDALNVYDKVLCIPALSQILVDQEKRDGQHALWNHMGKLSVLALKTVDYEERKWVMDALEDLQINSGYSSEDLSRNILQGDRSHVGIIPLLTFKYKVLSRWVGFWFTAIGLRPEDVVVLQERTRLHSSCFAAAAVPPGADYSWLGRLKPSAVAAFRLLEARACEVGGVSPIVGHIWPVVIK